jgi:hypothetical protein
MQAFGDAFGDAGRLQTLVNAVHTIVAFNGFAGLRIPLGRPPGTGGNAGLTPHAQVGLDKYDAVLGPFLHGPRRAGRNAPRILAVKTRHEHPGRAGQIVYFFGADRDNLGQARPDRQIVFHFAMGLAAEASNASPAILIDVIFAHGYSSNSISVIMLFRL